MTQLSDIGGWTLKGACILSGQVVPDGRVRGVRWGTATPSERKHVKEATQNERT